MTEQGAKWHTEIDRVFNKMKNEITEIKEKHRSILDKRLNEIEQTKSSIKGNLSTLKELKDSNDVYLVLKYRPKNKEFSNLPPTVDVTLPTFCLKPCIGTLVYILYGDELA